MPSTAQQFDGALKISLDAIRSSIISTAKAAHADIMISDPRPLGFVRHVDGVEAAPEEAVKSDGVIVYDYNRLDIVAKEALKLLRDNSPVGSGSDRHAGLYRDSHQLFIDQQPVSDLSGWRPGQEISISNTVIYARVIEVGARGSSTIKFSMPPHVYERVASALRRDPATQNTVSVQFTYRAVIGGGQINKATARGRGHNAAAVRYPTIILTPR